MRKIRFLLVGPGKVGVSLAAAWLRAGHRCVAVEGGNPESRRKARRLLRARGSGKASVSRPAEFDLLLLAVPDRRVASAARFWAGRVPWDGRIALHTSGVLGASALAPIRRHGASVGCLHPLVSLPWPRFGREVFKGIYFGIQGDPAAAAAARRLARDAGGKALVLGEEGRALYHLAACLASGYLLGLIDAAATRIAARSVSAAPFREALLALSESTLRNARARGIEASLTGPIPRGDVLAVRAHLASLRPLPSTWRELHRTLALHALELAEGSRGLSSSAASRFRRLLAAKR